MKRKVSDMAGNTIKFEIDTSELSRISREVRDTVNRFLLNKPVPLYMDTDCIVMDCDVRTSEDAVEYAKMFMAKYKHFTDVGTSKKQVYIKISDIKRPKFVHSLCASTRVRKSISDRDFDEATFRWCNDGDDTHCIMKLHDLKVVGITRKHPDDTPNEYIGKSLSFNRAFAKLEAAVNGVSDKTCVGYAMQPAFKGGYVHATSVGRTILCRAGTHIAKGDALYNGDDGKVYPKKSERPFSNGGYSGGMLETHVSSEKKDTIVFDFESTCGCKPSEMSDVAKRIMGLCEAETKSESTDKESGFRVKYGKVYINGVIIGKIIPINKHTLKKVPSGTSIESAKKGHGVKILTNDGGIETFFTDVDLAAGDRVYIAPNGHVRKWWFISKPNPLGIGRVFHDVENANIDAPNESAKESDDITITMSREEAVELFKTTAKTEGNVNVFKQLNRKFSRGMIK